MADIQLIIDVVGEQDMVKAIQTANRMKSEYKLLDKTFNKTNMSAQAYAKGVTQLDKKYDSLIAKTKALNKVQQTNNKVMSQAKNRMNGNNMAVQQLGYQVGDFAVQVQSGTSAFVAFSQQGAQLAGILPMIAKPLGLSMGAAIGLSAGLGILIPIIGIAGRAIFEFGDEADKSTDKADRLKSQMDSVTSSLRDFALAKEAANAGVSLDELFLTKQTGGVTEVKATITTLSKELDELRDQAKKGFTDIGLIAQTELQKGFAKYALSNVGKRLEKPTYIETMLSRVSKPRAEKGASTEERKMTQVATQNLSIQLQIADNLGKRREKTKEIMAEEAKLLPLKQLQAKYAEEDLLRSNESIRATEEKVRLLQTEIKHGADSAAVENLKKEFAVQEFAREVSLLNISDKRKMVLIEQFKIRQAGEVKLNKLAAQNEETYTRLLAQNEVFVNSLNEASDEARVKAEKQINLVAQLEEKYGEALVTALALAGVDISASMSDFIDKAVKAQSDLEGLGETYGTQLDIINAQIKALEEGKNVEVAAFIAGEKAKITALYESSKALATIADDTEALAEASLAFLAAMGQLDALAAAKTKLAGLNDASKGRGSSNVVNIKDIIAARELQMQQERSLIGLSEKQAAGQRVYYDLLKQNQDADVQLTETEIEGAARSIAAFEEQTRVLLEAEQEKQNLIDSIESSMADGFMSMVDGTKSVKDAFKDMAREIIKELYRVLVVKRLVSGITSTFNFGAAEADGGVWQSGSRINAYANGGIVSGPTMFPMAGGKTGLMGEAGPEAIMPLKRGANGKLGVQMEGGGGDNVVVHQNFNFQANGDDSVKRIIAQAAPQIANMTKKSMLDDRRRGGQMKATFG